MPQGITCWVEALAGVDRERTQARSDTLWPYWFPEPMLVIGSTSADRVRRAIRNWTIIREPWLSIQRDCEVTYKDRSAPVRVWREVLYDGPDTQEARERVRESVAQGAAVKKQTLNRASFMAAFQARFDMRGLRPEEPPLWYNRALPDPAPDVDNPVVDVPMRQIVWDLYEFGFRAELLALDTHFFPLKEGRYGERMVRDLLIRSIFSTDELFGMECVPASGVGLAASNAAERAEALEALRTLMLDWPDVPGALRTVRTLTPFVPVDVIIATEKVMARFYCHTFYRISGRAPLLPHIPPARVASL